MLNEWVNKWQKKWKILKYKWSGESEKEKKNERMKGEWMDESKNKLDEGWMNGWI